jgi:hypothetical protein
MAAFSGYYIHIAWRRPQEFAKTVRGWGHLNPLLPDLVAQSAAYRILTQLTFIITFVVGSMMFLILTFAILIRLF